MIRETSELITIFERLIRYYPWFEGVIWDLPLNLIMSNLVSSGQSSLWRVLETLYKAFGLVLYELWEEMCTLHRCINTYVHQSMRNKRESEKSPNGRRRQIIKPICVYFGSYHKSLFCKIWDIAHNFVMIIIISTSKY